MLNKEGDAVVVDFGVSNLFQDNDIVEGTAGSIFYFAPEIVKTGAGNKIIHGCKTDIWAMGVTIFQMATNSYPFDATSLHQI